MAMNAIEMLIRRMIRAQPELFLPRSSWQVVSASDAELVINRLEMEITRRMVVSSEAITKSRPGVEGGGRSGRRNKSSRRDEKTRPYFGQGCLARKQITFELLSPISERKRHTNTTHDYVHLRVTQQVLRLSPIFGAEYSRARQPRNQLNYETNQPHSRGSKQSWKQVTRLYLYIVLGHSVKSCAYFSII